METNDGKTRAVQAPVCPKGNTLKPRAVSPFRKQLKQRQRQSRPNRRRQQDAVSSSARNLSGKQQQQSTVMGSNKRLRLTPFAPHPSKLTGTPIRQRRQRRTNLAAISADTSSTSAIPTVTSFGATANVALNQSPQSPQQKRRQRVQAGSLYICSGCQQPIMDRYLLSACDKYWHDSCLKCNRCHAKLGELGTSLYATGDMNLCRQDYFEMFGQKAICAVCDRLIYATEMVMRARENVYHLECFACQLCGLRFCVGDRFHLCDNKIVCQYDYDEHIYPIQYQQDQHQQHYGMPQFHMQENSSLDPNQPEEPTCAPERSWVGQVDARNHHSGLNPIADEQQARSETTIAQDGPMTYHAMDSNFVDSSESNGEPKANEDVEPDGADPPEVIAESAPEAKQPDEETKKQTVLQEVAVACELKTQESDIGTSVNHEEAENVHGDMETATSNC